MPAQKKLSKISKELKKASKMHARQSKAVKKVAKGLGSKKTSTRKKR